MTTKSRSMQTTNFVISVSDYKGNIETKNTAILMLTQIQNDRHISAWVTREDLVELRELIGDYLK